MPLVFALVRYSMIHKAKISGSVLKNQYSEFPENICRSNKYHFNDLNQD